MKLSKNGKTVTMDRLELESMVRHLQEVEKLVKELESQEAKGELAENLGRPWSRLKKFLDSEDVALRDAAAKAPRAVNRLFCCQLITRDSNEVFSCKEFRVRYIFAISGCVALALAGGFNSQLTSGGCAGKPGCG